jgi:hypothetical protein
MFHAVYERLMASGRWEDTPEPRIFEGSDLVLEGRSAPRRELSPA